MKNILDHAKRGAENVGELAGGHSVDQSRLAVFIQKLLESKAFTKIEVDTTDGVKRSVEAVTVPVRGQGMNLLQALSDASPTVFLRHANRTTQGMISPNYDTDGRNKLGGVRFLGVRDDSFVIRNGSWVPEPTTGLYLAGATGLESKDVGGSDHAKIDVRKDPEHKISVYGAVSLGNIALARSHAQHDYRSKGGSVATGLTNGALGNVFAPGSIDTFSGFGAPITLDGTEGATIFIPRDYLERPTQSFGALMTGTDITPERVITGAALGAISDRGGNVVNYMRQMESAK